MCGAGLPVWCWGGGVGGGVKRSGAGQGADRAHRALRLLALGWAAVAARAVALILKLARMDILTIRGWSRAEILTWLSRL